MIVFAMVIAKEFVALSGVVPPSWLPNQRERKNEQVEEVTGRVDQR